MFPNPYRVEARWDANDLVRDHYLWFANLPKRCTIRIYTLGGDLVFETDFDGATYHGQGARGIYDPRERARRLRADAVRLDVRLEHDQQERPGGRDRALHVRVEDKDGGDRQVGKFLIVKSDREES